VGALGLLVETNEIVAIQREDSAKFLGGEGKNFIVRDLLVGAPGFVRSEDIVTEVPQLLDDAFREVLVGV
jgi:hypothetical protein